MDSKKQKKLKEDMKEIDKQMNMSYDAYSKKVLSCKAFAANILKGTLDAFKDCDIPEIVQCFEYGSKGDVPVDDILPMIDSMGSESVSVKEGRRIFDTKFKVKLPRKKYKVKKKGKGKGMSLIINIESQKNGKVGYPIEKRGFYYLSRLLSSQYNVEFRKSRFEDLEPVCSIWVCIDVADRDANTITRYKVRKENLKGNYECDESDYDLITLVVIRLGKNRIDDGDEFMNLLDMVFNKMPEGGIGAEECKDILKEKYQVTFEEEVYEEVENMCSVGESYYKKGEEQGREEGRIQGIEQGKAEGKIEAKIEMIDKLRAMGIKFEDALRVADIDKETFDKYNQKVTKGTSVS